MIQGRERDLANVSYRENQREKGDREGVKIRERDGEKECKAK